MYDKVLIEFESLNLPLSMLFVLGIKVGDHDDEDNWVYEDNSDMSEESDDDMPVLVDIDSMTPSSSSVKPSVKSILDRLPDGGYVVSGTWISQAPD